jgi:TPR repeat protein
VTARVKASNPSNPSLAEFILLRDIGEMKAALLAAIALGFALPSFGQYSARRLTRRIAPQTSRQPAAQQPAQPAPAPAPAPVAPAPAAPAAVVPAYQYAAVAPIARPAPPVDLTKAAAEKLKNDEKQFDYFKRRAEEGSDHAQYEIGVRYLAGRGVAPDEKLGRQWLVKAAKNGNSQAIRKLADMGIDPQKEAVEEIAKPVNTDPAPASATHATPLTKAAEPGVQPAAVQSAPK